MEPWLLGGTVFVLLLGGILFALNRWQLAKLERVIRAAQRARDATEFRALAAAKEVRPQTAPQPTSLVEGNDAP